MPKPEDLFRIFGVILLLLTSIGLVSRTAKEIFGKTGSKGRTRTLDPIYDLDLKRNESRVCPSVEGEDAFRYRYEETPCADKTMIHWYVPWEKHRIWEKFRRENLEKRMKKAREEAEILRREDTVREEGENRFVEEAGTTEGAGKGSKENPSGVVYTLVGALLVASCTVACWEVFKDRMKRRDSTDGKLRRDRSCSLADFTINRHLRRESREAEMKHLLRQASFDRSSKVTQTLIHQGSLDRAILKSNTEGKRRLLQTLLRFPSFHIPLHHRPPLGLVFKNH